MQVVSRMDRGHLKSKFKKTPSISYLSSISNHFHPTRLTLPVVTIEYLPNSIPPSTTASLLLHSNPCHLSPSPTVTNFSFSYGLFTQPRVWDFLHINRITQFLYSESSPSYSWQDLLQSGLCHFSSHVFASFSHQSLVPSFFDPCINLALGYWRCKR